MNPMALSIMAGIPALKELNADLRRRMDGAVATFQANLAATRTGRASVHMLDQVKVDYYGTPTPLNQLAQLGAPEPQLIVIAPYDPTALKEIEKAIRVADLGFNLIADRNVRGDGNEALQKMAKEKKISEDEEKRALEEVQKMTDEEIRRMEDLSHRKEAEVMQV